MKTLIISPSGKLYGSEQVLIDFLSQTKTPYTVAVNNRGELYKVLMNLKTNATLIPFNPSGLRYFYLRLFLQLLIGKYDRVYWNEGGHINYSLLLARLFPTRKFFVHIRIFEDTNTARWIRKPTSNISFIVVSRYIQRCFPEVSELIYDPYEFKGVAASDRSQKGITRMRVGIIGRITFSKGISLLVDLLHVIRNNGLQEKYEFVFIGNVSDDVKDSEWLLKMQDDSMVNFAGFIGSKQEIYGRIDCVMHLSKQEALGRIFLEALDADIPFVGLNAGGIGEIVSLAGLKDSLVDPDTGNTAALILEKLEWIRNNYQESLSQAEKARLEVTSNISLGRYIEELEKKLTA